MVAAGLHGRATKLLGPLPALYGVTRNWLGVLLFSPPPPVVVGIAARLLLGTSPMVHDRACLSRPLKINKAAGQSPALIIYILYVHLH